MNINQISNQLIELSKTILTIQQSLIDISNKNRDAKQKRLDYSRSEKGRARQKIANKKYYETKLKTGNPVGRPKKKIVV